MSTPFIFNDDELNLIQVNMSGSVGRGGKNTRDDVVLIQTLINAVPERLGGSAMLLSVDGIAGSKTNNAINRFQTANGLIADGRIDCGRSTIKKLVPLLRSNNLMPRGLTNVGDPDPKISDFLSRGYQNSQSKSFTATNIETKWKFAGSGTVGISVGYFGATVGDLLISTKDSQKIDYRLSFHGITVGLGALPIGFDIGFEAMKSYGSSIFKGSGAVLLQSVLDKPNDFVGSCTMLSVAAQAAVGVSGTVIGFGYAGEMATKAYGALTGQQVGLPTVEISLFVGIVAGWR